MSLRSYFTDYIRELARTSKRALEQTDYLAVPLAILFGVGSWLLASDHHPSAHQPWYLLAALLASVLLIRLFTTPYAVYVQHRTTIDQLQERLTPQLEMQAPNIILTNRGSTPAAYVRLAVHNTSEGIAAGCSARLTRVEHQSRDGSYRELAYNDNLEMVWSGKAGDPRIIDIHAGSTEFLDVVYGQEMDRNLHLATAVSLNAYEHLMTAAGHYRFTVQIACAGRAPLNVQLQAHWGYGRTLDFPGDPITIF